MFVSLDEFLLALIAGVLLGSVLAGLVILVESGIRFIQVLKRVGRF